MEVKFDFETIYSIKDFYEEFEERLDVGSYFGQNLDALYDVISGDLELPLKIVFENMEPFQLEEFEGLIKTMEDLAENLDEFEFSYFIRDYNFDGWDN